MVLEQLGDYSKDDTKQKAEVVDAESWIESAYVKDIKETLRDTDDSLNALCEDCLEKLNRQQFVNYLTAKFFPNNEAMKYSEITGSNNKKFVDFCMKAALKFLVYENDDWKKYDENTWNLLTDGNWKSAEEILKARWGIDNDNDWIDSVIVRILQNKVKATVDWKPWPQTIAKILTAFGEDTSEIYQRVNNIYKGTRFEIKDMETKNLFDTNYSIDGAIFKVTNKMSDNTGDYYLITHWNGNAYRVYKQGGNLVFKKVGADSSLTDTDEIEVGPNNLIRMKKKSAPAAPSSGDWISPTDNTETPVTLQEIEDTGIKINDSGELVNDNWDPLNNEKTNFVGGLIDDEIDRGADTRNWYDVTHSKCMSMMNEWKLSYDKTTNTINYKNINGWRWLIYNISKVTNGEFSHYTITDKSQVNAPIQFQFATLDEAINTIKLMEYIRIRFDWVETWADDASNDNCTSNESPFFYWEYRDKLYFSSDHGGVGGVVWIYNDDNIITKNNLKKISNTVFKKNENIIAFAQYLVKTVNINEES